MSQTQPSAVGLSDRLILNRTGPYPVRFQYNNSRIELVSAKPWVSNGANGADIDESLYCDLPVCVRSRIGTLVGALNHPTLEIKCTGQADQPGSRGDATLSFTLDQDTAGKTHSVQLTATSTSTNSDSYPTLSVVSREDNTFKKMGQLLWQPVGDTGEGAMSMRIPVSITESNVDSNNAGMIYWMPSSVSGVTAGEELRLVAADGSIKYIPYSNATTTTS